MEWQRVRLENRLDGGIMEKISLRRELYKKVINGRED